MNKRFLELEPSNLFGDKAILVSLTGHEEMSRPFEYSLTIDCPNENIKPEDVIGKPLAVRIDRGELPERYIHGYISQLLAGDALYAKDKSVLPARAYRVRLVPWFWFLSKAARCFVYLPEKKEKTIQEVFDKVLERVKSYGHVETWHDAKAAAILKSRKVEHCIQYRETDFNFLSRLLEQYGVYFYFKHEKTKHTLVLSDKPTYPICEESEIDYPADSGTLGQKNDLGCISSWDHSYDFISGKWEQLDYDFLNPSTSLKVNASKHALIPLKNNAGYEVYDNTNDYVKKPDGREESTRRMEEEEVRFSRVLGTSTCVTLAPGHVFKLASHYSCPNEANKSYLITSVNHMAAQPGRMVSSGGGQSYTNQFTCIPNESQFRPARSTPHPNITSVQTAFVVGPAGEEIYTDEHGRVKVQFHWDREGKRDENTCCWVRVSQVHAGPGFGGIDIPRIGEEVLVSFVEGDPDRPVITGRLYNAQSMPPFGLPGEKTRSGMKTKTYKGSGYNELSMDDTPGKEQIRIHGQYNLDTVIEHDETHTIHNNRTKQVDVDEKMTIGKNQTLDVGVNKTVTIGVNHTETVGANQTVQIGANQSTTIGAMKTETVGASSTETVGAAKALTVGAAYAITVGAAMISTVGSNSSEQVGGSSSEAISKKKTVTAGEEISLICGDSKIVMKKDGSILIQGKDIVVKGSGKITAKASGDMVLKGAKIGEN
ncbi:MAG: type VI secretion system tip protein TssI/VgrG [Pirellula sp.]